MKNTIPDIWFEQYLLDELPEEKKRLVEDSPNFRQKIDELEKSNNELLEYYSPKVMTAQILEKSETQNAEKAGVFHKLSSFLKPIVLVPTGAFGLLLAAVFFIALLSPGVLNLTDGVRAKGQRPHLNIYRQLNGDAELLEPEAMVNRRDSLQVSYVAADQEYGAIVSLDGRGVVSLHYPENSNADNSLDTQGESFLSYSYVLDDAPDFERFFFITSQQDFDVDNVIQSIQELAADSNNGETGMPDLPDHINVQSYILNKETGE